MERKITEFFTKHKIEPRQVTARSFIFDCPACGSSKKLYIQKKDGSSVCFRQGDADRCPHPGSRPFYPLHLLSGLSIDEIKAEFMDDRISDGNEMQVSLDLEEITEKEESIPVMSPDSLPIDALPVLYAFSQDGTAYLKSRGITEDIMLKYGILYSDAMRRVIFPVFMNGAPYGWQGRSVDPVDKAFRMYNLPGPWKARTVMFYDNLLKSEHVIIAEGAISALKFEHVGGFVATMGKNISQVQIKLISSSNIKKVYLALDRDASDQLEKLYKTFLSLDNPIKDVYIVEVPSHRDDFGDCTFEECETAFKTAKPYNPNTINVFLGD